MNAEDISVPRGTLVVLAEQHQFGGAWAHGWHLARTCASVLRSWRVRRPDGSRSEFAVHREIGGSDWAVTHVPSGTSVSRPTGKPLASQREAYRWARSCIEAKLEWHLAGLQYGSRAWGTTSGAAAEDARWLADSLYRVPQFYVEQEPPKEISIP